MDKANWDYTVKRIEELAYSDACYAPSTSEVLGVRWADKEITRLTSLCANYRGFIAEIAAMEPAEHYIGDHGIGSYEECGQCEDLIERANALLDVKE